MNKSLSTIKYLLLASLALAAATHAAETLPFYNSEEFTPRWIEPGSADLEDFHQIPAFSFSNQDGAEITEQSFAGKIYVASFFFSTCPGICPTLRSKLLLVQNNFLEDEAVLILSHSIRPTADTVEVLQAYAQQNEVVSGKWHLATGEKEEIYQLAKDYYFASEDLGNIENTNDFLHTENLFLIDQNRHIRGIYNGLNTVSVGYLIQDIQTLKNETAELLSSAGL